MPSFSNSPKEVLEINTVIYDVMPSDISMFSDNAIKEEVSFRSKGAFAFRSKKSRSKIVLTFPIPLLDTGKRSSYSSEELQLFDNGLELMGQLNNFPFCFVRSARIQSYLGVSFDSPSNYLMFGVEEINLIQDLRVPGVLFAEISLLFNNHMNLVQDMHALGTVSVVGRDGYKYISEGGTFDNLGDSPLYVDYMRSLSGDMATKYSKLIRSKSLSTNGGSFNPAEMISDVRLLVPHIYKEDDILQGPVGEDGFETIEIEGRKYNHDTIDNPFMATTSESFDMYDKYDEEQPYNVSSVGSLDRFDTGIEEQLVNFRKDSDEAKKKKWKVDYLEDKFIFSPEINAIQSVRVSRANSFASHHIGSSQYPYLQYIGRLPSRMSISTAYNSAGTYEINEQSTMNLFQVMLNSVDSNNLKYPGANAVNFLKIFSVGSVLLDVQNFIPSECELQASADNSNIDFFQSNFVENSMDVLLEESKVFSGKNVAASEVTNLTSILLLAYYDKLLSTLRRTDHIYSFKFHKETLKPILELYEGLLKERTGSFLEKDKIVGVQGSNANGGNLQGETKTALILGDGSVFPYKNHRIAEFVNGANNSKSKPRDILTYLKANIAKEGRDFYKGRPVILGTGFVNEPRKQTPEIKETIRLLNSMGAFITVQGVPWDFSVPGTAINSNEANKFLRTLAMEEGANFLGKYEPTVAGGIEPKNPNLKISLVYGGIQDVKVDIKSEGGVKDNFSASAAYGVLLKTLVKDGDWKKEKEILSELAPMVQETSNFLSVRDSVIAYREGLTNRVIGQTVDYIVKDSESTTKLQTFADTYQINPNVSNLIASVNFKLSVEASAGNYALEGMGKDYETNESYGSINNIWLNSFKYDAQRDLGLNKYINDVEVRKYLDPFFFVKTVPIIKRDQFEKIFDVLQGDMFDRLQELINRDVSKAAALSNGGDAGQEFFGMQEALKERRYKAEEGADRVTPQSSAVEISGAWNDWSGEVGDKELNANIRTTLKQDKLYNYGSIEAAYGLPRGLLAAMSAQESGGNPNAKSHMGARGAFQFMPKTGPSYGLSTANDYADFKNIPKAAVACAKYMKFLYARKVTKGRIEVAIAGYNAGEGNIDKYGGIPPFKETKAYVIKVMGYLAQAQKVIKDGTIAGEKTPTDTETKDGAKTTQAKDTSEIDAKRVQAAKDNPMYFDIKKAVAEVAAGKPIGDKNKVDETPYKKYVPSAADDAIAKKFLGKGKLGFKILDFTGADIIKVQAYGSNTIDKTPFQLRLMGTDSPDLRNLSDAGVQYWAPQYQEGIAAYSGGRGSVIMAIFGTFAGKPMATVFPTTSTVNSINSVNAQLVLKGHSMASQGGAYKDHQAQAKSTKRGMWGSGKTLDTPKQFREKALKAAKLKANPKASTFTATNTSPSTATATPHNANVSAAKTSSTNTFIPLQGGNISKNWVNSPFGARKLNGNSWHYGIDIQSNRGDPVIASSSGFAVARKSDTAGNWIKLTLDAQGFSCDYFHLDRFSNKVPTLGKAYPVKAGDVIGYVGNSGTKDIHLHYQARYNDMEFNPLMSVELDTIPKGIPLNPWNFLHPRAFVSASRTDNTSNNPRYNKNNLNGYKAPENLGDGSTAVDRNLTQTQIKGYDWHEEFVIPPEMSVYSNALKQEKHLDKMFSNMDAGLNLCFPVIKGYVTVGNEDDDLISNETEIRTSTYFELPNIQEFHLATNNDFNPVDVCSFSLLNPAAIRTMAEDADFDPSSRDLTTIDTEYYSLFYGQAVKLRPGMKVHIRGGYSNDPNRLKTMFNGTIKEMSGALDARIDVVCESYGVELVNNVIAPAKPEDLSNNKNASTGLLMAYSLMSENINHFGAQIERLRSVWTWLPSLMPNIDMSVFGMEEKTGSFGGKGQQGDFRDPENKALICPINMGDFILQVHNPSRANSAQRLFTNIYSDAIEYAHDTYASTWWTRWKNLFFTSMDTEVFYNYWAFRSNSWSVMKEMEYRHPGTLAKPLWYEDRQTMFFGIKEQLYVARDLDPAFMFLTGQSTKSEAEEYRSMSDSYLVERHKRLEPATGFHLLSSKLNILDNNLGWSRDFKTKINVIYYKETYEGNDVRASSPTHEAQIDDNIKPFDIREKTIALNGCHEAYVSWLYGIQELKKQSEMMYSGFITVTGKPDMRAGDYAYLSDTDRGFEGIIKIRECNHHYSRSTGYTTVITPGLYVECTQFFWDSFFLKLGAVSKMALMKMDLEVNHTLTSSRAAKDYLYYLKEVQGLQSRVLGDYLFGVVGSGFVASMAGFLTYSVLLRNNSLLSIRNIAAGIGEAVAASSGYADFSKKTASDLLGRGSSALKDVWQKNFTKNFRSTAALVDPATGKVSYGSKVSQALKSAVQVGKDVITLARKGETAVKRGRIIRWSGTALRVVGSATQIGFKVLNSLRKMIVAHPFGALITVIVEFVLSSVTSKVKKMNLTHNPLMLFPITYNGKPFVTGISGFDNESILRGMITNLKRNLTDVEKATYVLNARSNGDGGAAIDTFTTISSAVAKGEGGVLNVLESIAGLLGE